MEMTKHSSTTDSSGTDSGTSSNSATRTAQSIREDLQRQTSRKKSESGTRKIVPNRDQQCLPNTNVTVDFSSFNFNTTSPNSCDPSKPFPFLIPYPSSLISIERNNGISPSLPSTVTSKQVKRKSKSDKRSSDKVDSGSVGEQSSHDTCSLSLSNASDVTLLSSPQQEEESDSGTDSGTTHLEYDSSQLSHIIDHLLQRRDVACQTLVIEQPIIPCQTPQPLSSSNNSPVSNGISTTHLRTQLDQMTYLVEEMSRERSKHNIDMHHLQKALKTRDLSLEKVEKQNRDFTQEVLQLKIAREKIEILLDDYRKRLKEFRDIEEKKSQETERKSSESAMILEQQKEDKNLILELQNKNQESESRIQQLEDQIRLLQNRIQYKTEEYSRLKTDLNGLKGDSLSLKNLLDVNRNFLLPQSDHFKPLIESITQQYQQSLHSHKESTDSKLTQRDNLISDLEQNIQELKNHNEDLNNQVKESQSLKTKTQQELEETKHRLHLRESEFDSLSLEMNDLKNRKHEEINELQNQLEKQRLENHAMSANTAKIEEENKKLRFEINSAKTILLEDRERRRKAQEEQESSQNALFFDIKNILDSEQDSGRPYGDVQATIREIKDELNLLKQSFLS